MIVLLAAAWICGVMFAVVLCKAAADDSVPEVEQRLEDGQCLPCWLYQHHECERGACRCPACGRGPANSREIRKHA